MLNRRHVEENSKKIQFIYSLMSLYINNKISTSSNMYSLNTINIFLSHYHLHEKSERVKLFYQIQVKIIEFEVRHCDMTFGMYKITHYFD